MSNNFNELSAILVTYPNNLCSKYSLNLMTPPRQTTSRGTLSELEEKKPVITLSPS